MDVAANRNLRENKAGTHINENINDKKETEMREKNCIFCKIIAGEIPARTI